MLGAAYFDPTKPVNSKDTYMVFLNGPKIMVVQILLPKNPVGLINQKMIYTVHRYIGNSKLSYNPKIYQILHLTTMQV